MNLKIVMVEGPHDGAFISKVMKVNGYKTCSTPIGAYHPSFIAKYLKNQYTNAPVNELNLQSIRQQIILPSYSLVSENEMILLFQMGGDNRIDKRYKLVSDIYKFLKSQITFSDIPKGLKVTFVYEFDADEIGIQGRLEQINREIKQIDKLFPGISANASYTVSTGIRWGAFIFANNSGKGKLEDIILPMMEEDNDDIARCAEDFVNKRDSFALFQNVKSTTHPFKARVGVMGQLEKAGSANPAIIEQSSYLTDKKIKNSSICNQLFYFLAN